MGRQWSQCPYGELRDPLWRAAVYLGSLLDAGLVSNVADTHSAGVSAAIVALRWAQAEMRAQRQAEELDALRGM